MASKETLKSSEIFVPAGEKSHSADLTITKEETDIICAQRQKYLREIRSFVGPEFYDRIGEKLANEKRQFEQLLNFQNARDEILSQYSFVLNPYYFEQKFIGTEN